MIAALIALLAMVNIANPSVSYACDGVTATYAVVFPYLTSNDLVTTTTTAGGVTTTLTQVTDYSVNLSSTSTTATLTVNVPATKCPAGNTLKISRVVAYTQPYSFRAQTQYNQSLHETAYDRLAMQIQQLATILPTAVALGLQEEGVALGNISTLNCVGPGLTCTALAGVGSATVSTAAPTTIPNSGNTNSAGTADSLSRSDHVHALAVGPMMSASQSSGQSITNNTDTIVIYATVERDTDSAYNSGTGRFTVPTGKGGDYAVTCSVMWGASAGTNSLVSIWKNAVAFKTTQILSSGVGTSEAVTSINNYAAGDIIDCRVKQNSGGAVAFSAFAANNWISIKRIQ